MSVQSKNKKICIVSISLGKGGAERSCAMLSEMLTAMGHEVHLVILNDIIDYNYAGKLFNLGVLKTANDGLLGRFKRFSILRKFLRSENFDYIIDHRSKNHYYRELFYYKYVYKGQNTIYVTHSSKKEQYLTQFPKKFSNICNKNYHNVGVSSYIEKEVLQHTGIQNTTTIHNAYDPDWSDQTSELPDGLGEKKYVLAYGRIVDAIKDFSFLIKSFEHSKLYQTDVYLVIMGDGPDKEMLEQLSKEGRAADYVMFLPFVKSPFSIIKNAQFVTLTSTYEGFPMVLVEALSVGTPVISLDIVSGPNEIIQHEENGLLIRERSLPLFAAAMERMSSDQRLYGHCARNAKNSVAQFSKTEIAKKWNLLLK